MKSKHVKISANRFVEIYYENTGRLSLLVKDGGSWNPQTVVDVELPAMKGEHENAFKPTVKIGSGVDVIRSCDK